MTARALALANGLMVALTTAAAGQGRLIGRVFDAATRLPLADVEVSLLGGDVTVRTDSAGRYQFDDTPRATLDIRLARAGYVTSVERVVLIPEHDTDIADFGLVPIGVMFAQPAGTEGKPSAKGKVREAAGGARNLADVFHGRTPARVYPGGGHAGALPRITLRGLQSLVLSQDPLIFVDGMRSDRSVLNQLDPDQIDRIEVLTGPEATTRYGTGAANGVVLIYRKRD